MNAPARKIRVLAILPSDDFTGPAGQVVSTVAELARKSVTVSFALLSRRGTATGRLPALLDAQGIAYEILEDRGPLDLRLAGAIRQLVARWQPDIVETHGYKASALAFLVKAFDARLRWIGFFHGLTTESTRARLYHRLDRWLLARADRVVTISEEQRMHLQSIPDVRVIHSAVTALDSLTAGQPTDVAFRLDQAERPRIAVVGRLSPEKGVDIFLDAVARLAADSEPFSAIIAGDGPERDRLVHQSRNLGISDRVHFLGHVTQPRLVYERIDLLVIPSRSEGLPSVLLEALHADVPVVATRVGAIPRVLATPDSGILTGVGSAQDLADAILAGLTRLHTPAARQARAAVAKQFSQESRASSLRALYDEVLAAHRSTSTDDR